MAWWLEKVVRAPGRTAAWFHHGTAVHSAIEEWERAGRISDDGAVEIFVNEYDQLISQHKQSHPDLSLWLRGRGSTEKDIETRRTKGVDQVEWYTQFAKESDFEVWKLPDGSPAIEVPFEIQLGCVTVVGYIDVVWQWPDGSIEPVDYKTGTSDQDPYQLALYRVALEELYGVSITHGRYVKLAKKTADPIDLTHPAYSRVWLDNLFADFKYKVEMSDERPTITPKLGKTGIDCFTCTQKDNCLPYQAATTAL